MIHVLVQIRILAIAVRIINLKVPRLLEAEVTTNQEALPLLEAITSQEVRRLPEATTNPEVQLLLEVITNQEALRLLEATTDQVEAIAQTHVASTVVQEAIVVEVLPHQDLLLQDQERGDK
jgi:hypothetical protein